MNENPPLVSPPPSRSLFTEPDGDEDEDSPDISVVRDDDGFGALPKWKEWEAGLGPEELSERPQLLFRRWGWASVLASLGVDSYVNSDRDDPKLGTLAGGEEVGLLKANSPSGDGLLEAGIVVLSDCVDALMCAAASPPSADFDSDPVFPEVNVDEDVDEDVEGSVVLAVDPPTGMLEVTSGVPCF